VIQKATVNSALPVIMKDALLAIQIMIGKLLVETVFSSLETLNEETRVDLYILSKLHLLISNKLVI